MSASIHRLVHQAPAPPGDATWLSTQETVVGVLGHELKNMMTVMNITAQLLYKQSEQLHDEALLRLCQRMNRQLLRATNLISDVLDRSRIHQGTFLLRKKPLRLDILVAEMLEDVQATLQTHQLLLECQDQVQVDADPERIEQVLINLLTNAVKFSPRARVVRLSVRKEQAQAVVQVQDFGIGIAPQHHEQIFDQFYQAPDSLEHARSGLGLGLYLAREIIKRHDGRIWVDSWPGEGTTFSFSLPLLQATVPRECEELHGESSIYRLHTL